MKNSIIHLRTTLLASLFFTALNCTFSQSKIFAKLFQRVDVPVVAIKVYESNNGFKTLLAYHPSQHNLLYYETEQFSVRWYQDGKLVGQQARLENAYGHKFTVVVSDWTTGRASDASYSMVCKR